MYIFLTLVRTFKNGKLIRMPCTHFRSEHARMPLSAEFSQKGGPRTSMNMPCPAKSSRSIISGEHAALEYAPDGGFLAWYSFPHEYFAARSLVDPSLSSMHVGKDVDVNTLRYLPVQPSGACVFLMTALVHHEIGPLWERTYWHAAEVNHQVPHRSKAVWSRGKELFVSTQHPER